MDFGVLVALGVAVLLAALVVAGVLAVRRERERQRRIQDWAVRHDWVVEKNPRVPWAARLPGRGSVSLLVRGVVRGYRVGVAEYSYTTTSTSTDSSGNSRSSTTVHRFRVVAVQVPGRYAPVAVEPRGAVSRFGRAVFGDAASALGHAEFDRRFRVRTRHPDQARAVLGPALVGEHLADRVPAWSLAEDLLLTWRPNEHIADPQAIPALTAPLLRVAELLGR